MTAQDKESQDDRDGRGVWGLHHIHICCSHSIPSEQLQKVIEKGR